MVLSAIGRVASAQWLELPYRFADLELGEWVIMPNHIHGILVITGKGEASFTGRSDASAVFSRDPLVGDFASPLYNRIKILQDQAIVGFRRPVGWRSSFALPGSLFPLLNHNLPRYALIKVGWVEGGIRVMSGW